jgi:hypothetical protein
MKIRILFFAFVIFISCSEEQEINDKQLNENSKEISLDDFEKSNQQSSIKKGDDCLDNCFYTPDFNFWSTTSTLQGQVTFHWNYGGSIVLNPDVCNTTAYIQFRAINNETTCDGETVVYSGNYNMDITNDFLATSSGQIVVSAPAGSNAVIQNYELPNKIYEYRIVITAQCGVLSCCYDTDWDCFSTT